MPSSQASEETDPALRVVDAWDVTGPETFPEGDILNAGGPPTLLEAPNGDLLATFQTTGDANPGGELRLIRSTDQGRTWGPSRVIATSLLYGDAGAIASARGEATLADGTLLIAYSDGRNNVRFNNRESAVFVARSTDNGHTWTGTDEPFETPIPMREAWVAGQIIELDDGTLLLPVWGALELVEDWETDPMRWRSGVLRSFDSGQTWSDHRTIAYDPNNPPQFPPFHSSNYTSGANEVELHQLPDGRIVAVIRYATGVGPARGQVYLSYSDDAGATWTPPVATAEQAEAMSLTTAPCTDRLSGGHGKLVIGHRHLSPEGVRTGRMVLDVSFDGGVTWEGQTDLQDSSGASQWTGTGEPAFHRLSDDQLLVLFRIRPAGELSRIVANVVEDARDAQSCQAQADAANQRAAENPTIFIERADRDQWAWPFATRKFTHPSTTTVADVIGADGRAINCRATDDLWLSQRDGDVLDPSATLAEAGVTNGAMLRLNGTAPSSPWRIGFAELDLFPQTRHVYGWDQACALASWALDYRARALGLDVNLPAGMAASAVELRDRDQRSRLTAGDYRLFSSPDNERYAEIESWSFSSRVEDGRLVHRFDGLAVTDRFLKIHQPHTDTSYSFVLTDPRADVSVEFEPLPCDTTVMGRHDAPLVVGPGLTCLEDAVVSGPVTVGAGAQVRVTDSSITGPLRSAGASAVSVCGSRITGPVSISNTTGLVVVGDSGVGCGSNTVTGPVSLVSNVGAVRIGGNTIVGPLVCDGNETVPVDAGQPNSVEGPKSGQCAGL